MHAYLEGSAGVVRGLGHGLGLLVPALRLGLGLLRMRQLGAQQLELHLQLPGAVHVPGGRGVRPCGAPGGGGRPCAFALLWGVARVKGHLQGGLLLLGLLERLTTHAAAG